MFMAKKSDYLFLFSPSQDLVVFLDKLVRNPLWLMFFLCSVYRGVQIQMVELVWATARDPGEKHY